MLLSEIKITPIIDSIKLEDISDEVYFSKKYKSYISNSRLSLINPEQGGSPEKFFNGKFDNFSDSLLFGSACHQLVLQPERYFICQTIERPTAKAGFMADELYHKDGLVPSNQEIIKASNKINYYKDKMDSNRIEELKNKCYNYWRNRALFETSYRGNKIPIYLDNKSKIRLQECLESLKKNNKIQELLRPKNFITPPKIGNEKTLLMDFKVEVPNKDSFILKFKSKLDNYTVDFDTNKITVNDLKTTGKTVNVFNDAILNYHYYREMAIYSYLLSIAANKFFKLKDPKINSNFLVISTIPNYYTKVVPMTKQLFLKGFNEFKNLLRLVSYYLSSDTKLRNDFLGT